MAGVIFTTSPIKGHLDYTYWCAVIICPMSTDSEKVLYFLLVSGLMMFKGRGRYNSRLVNRKKTRLTWKRNSTVSWESGSLTTQPLAPLWLSKLLVQRCHPDCRTLTHVYIFESHSAQTRLITYDRPYSTELQGFQDKSTPLEWFRYVIVHSLVMSPSFCDHLMEWAGKHLKKCDVTDKTIRLTETRSKHKK